MRNSDQPLCAAGSLPTAALVLAFVLPGCAYYSFTGATIPTHLETVSIPIVQDNSTSPVTGLSDLFTEMLSDRFVDQTRLVLEPDESSADVVLQATIERYVNQPTSVGAGEQAAQNRVSITVSVVYADQVEEEELLARTFTAAAEYSPAEQGFEGEQEAAELALDTIADDIFTAATSNW